MQNMEHIETLEKQRAALIHIASSCEDQGIAICIENVCCQLESVEEKLVADALPEQEKEQASYKMVPVSKEVRDRSTMKMFGSLK